MEVVGNIVLYIIMACCAAGAIAHVVNENSELAKAFTDGIAAMAALFLPIVGLMVSVPFIIYFAENIFGALFRSFGADPAVAAAMIVPADCGGYATFLALAASPEIVVIALCIAIMMASTISFNIPLGLSILQKEDRPYLALGAMSGFLSIPFGVLITCFILSITKPAIRTTFTTVGAPDYVLNIHMGTVLINLIPVLILCILLSIGLWKIPKAMVKGFTVFGKIILSIMTLITAASIIEHYTGVFTAVFGSWGFDPMLADEENLFRAIELLGSIAMMLAGAFPMVYLIRRFFGKKIAKVGKKVGLDETGSAGILAAMANGVALFSMVKDMNPRSKVICISFCVCAGYSLGDWIAFNVNFQPSLVVPVFIGQLCGGILGIFISKLLAVPQIEKLTEEKNPPQSDFPS